MIGLRDVVRNFREKAFLTLRKLYIQTSSNPPLFVFRISSSVLTHVWRFAVAINGGEAYTCCCALAEHLFRFEQFVTPPLLLEHRT